MDSACSNPNGGPQMNTDISGPGVRVSFYLQTLFLSCLCARSASIDEIIGALYTLLFTNTAMAVTALILGLKPNAEISFHDGLVVYYLLNLSWVTVYFSLPVVAKFPNVRLLLVFSVLQSYTIFAFAFAMLITANSFGSHPSCNRHAVVVLFHSFPAFSAGRIVCLVMTTLIAAGYTGILIKDHLPPVGKGVFRWIQKRVTKEVPATDHELPITPPENHPPPRQAPRAFGPASLQHHARKAPLLHKEYDLQIAWNVVIEITVKTIIWALAVMNTELLINWSNFAPSDGQQSSWQFGQVLPMFLVVLPLANLITAFQTHGLRPGPPMAAKT
ncbi:hypothetical protein B0H19DRAFT_1256467 [Mycena capillaripes]|nr:hypothetical protein B0H19DRAFT_1256467 [Mycena capillaripes]